MLIMFCGINKATTPICHALHAMFEKLKIDENRNLRKRRHAEADEPLFCRRNRKCHVTRTFAQITWQSNQILEDDFTLNVGGFYKLQTCVKSI